jgi:hypothetical protein
VQAALTEAKLQLVLQGKSLADCFSKKMRKLYLERISIADVAVHILVGFWLLLFVALLVLNFRFEGYYTSGVGMCLGRCASSASDTDRSMYGKATKPGLLLWFASISTSAG